MIRCRSAEVGPGPCGVLKLLRRALIVDGPGHALGWTDLDTNDRRTIASGLEKGASEPYTHVVATEAPAQPAGRTLRIRRASQVRPRIARWLWEPDVGRIPLGELSLVAGRGNVGKSPYTLWVAARITRGDLPGALHGSPRDVLIYASEDSIDHTIVPRLMAADADLDRVHFVEGTVTADNPEMPLDWGGDLPLIEEYIGRVEAALVVLDPLAVVYKSSTDANNPKDMREALDPLVRLAHKTGSTVLGITHFNKARSTDVATLLSQSHALRDVPRAVIVCAQTGDGERILGQDKNNLGRTGDDVPCLTYAMESRDVAIPDEHGVMQLVSVPAFVITGTTDESLADALGRVAESNNEAAAKTVPEQLRWMFECLAQAHPYPVTATLLTDMAEERGGQKWDTQRRAAGRTKLMEHRPEHRHGSRVPAAVGGVGDPHS